MLQGDLGFLDDFFDLGDFLLDFAGHVFDDAVGFEVWIVDQFAGLGFDGAFYFVERARGCVFGAVFHRGVPPARFDEQLAAIRRRLSAG